MKVSTSVQPRHAFVRTKGEYRESSTHCCQSVVQPKFQGAASGIAFARSANVAVVENLVETVHVVQHAASSLSEYLSDNGLVMRAFAKADRDRGHAAELYRSCHQGFWLRNTQNTELAFWSKGRSR